MTLRVISFQDFIYFSIDFFNISIRMKEGKMKEQFKNMAVALGWASVALVVSVLFRLLSTIGA